MKAYHFTNDTLRSGERIPQIGEWLMHRGPIIACTSGLHASEHPFDGLTYAPGPLLHLVELDGEIVSHGNPTDKLVGRRRKILATVDAWPLLIAFARWSALSVVHLWNPPEVVMEYLRGDDSKSAAARDAASAAASAAARDDAWAAASAAAWAAARDAAWAAARAAASAATWAAAWAAASAAAWAAASAAQRSEFKRLVDIAFESGVEK